MKDLKINKIIKAPEESKSITNRLFDENINKKLDSYLKKYSENDYLLIELNIEKNKKSNKFNGTLLFELNKGEDKKVFQRDGYVKLDDLINHLFTHLKESFIKIKNINY
jgi:hypothetical protein